MKKKILMIFGIILALLLIGVGTYWYLHYEKPFRDRYSANITIAGTAYVAEVADTPVTRIQGLSGQKKLRDKVGMFFTYASPGKYPFWMKEMLFPLDIIWFDQDFKVVEVMKDISPSTYPNTFVSKVPAQYIFEVNAGTAEKYGIKEGDIATVERH